VTNYRASVRTLAAGGIFIATPVISHAAPGTNDGKCAAAQESTDPNNPNTATNHHNKPGGVLVDNGTGGPTVYASGSGAPDPSNLSGYIGVSGSHGYLEAGGDPAAATGWVTGHNTESGANGSLLVGAAPSICVGNGTTGVNS
jgi:hypothetical protein